MTFSFDKFKLIGVHASFSKYGGNLEVSDWFPLAPPSKSTLEFVEKFEHTFDKLCVLRILEGFNWKLIAIWRTKFINYFFSSRQFPENNSYFVGWPYYWTNISLTRKSNIKANTRQLVCPSQRDSSRRHEIRYLLSIGKSIISFIFYNSCFRWKMLSFNSVSCLL